MSTTPETAFEAAPAISEAASLASHGISSTIPEASPDNPPWGILAAFLTWIAGIGLLFIVPNVTVLPYLAYHYRGVAVTQEILFADKTFVFLFILGWLPAHLLTLALIWAVATRLSKRSIKQVFGWSWSPNFGFWRSSALAVSLFVLTMVLIGLLGGQKTELDRILESSRAAAITVAIIAVATAPLVEEMIYRGLLYSAFQRAIGQWAAVVVVSGMFAGLHVFQYWPNVGAISSITLLSVVLTLIRARTGRLLPCVVVHLVFNGITSVLIILEPYIRAAFELWRHEPVKKTITFMHFLN